VPPVTLAELWRFKTAEVVEGADTAVLKYCGMVPCRVTKTLGVLVNTPLANDIVYCFTCPDDTEPTSTAPVAIRTPSALRAACALLPPVPPFATGNTPVTPGVTLAVPLNDAADVDARFV
jgi:hypothetical protein